MIHTVIHKSSSGNGNPQHHSAECNQDAFMDWHRDKLSQLQAWLDCELAKQLTQAHPQNWLSSALNHLWDHRSKIWMKASSQLKKSRRANTEEIAFPITNVRL